MNLTNNSPILENLMLYDNTNNSFYINKKPMKDEKEEGQVLSAYLIGPDDIIFSIKKTPKIIRLHKVKKEWEFVHIFNGSSNTNFNFFSQIRTDYQNKDVFYTYSKSKIIEFKIENDTATINSTFEVEQEFHKYAICSKFIAIQENKRNHEHCSIITVYSRSPRKKIFQIKYPTKTKIYLDKYFLYIYDKQQNLVDIYSLDNLTGKPYRTIINVVKIVEGDRIGIEKVQNKSIQIEILGCETKSKFKQCPVYSYIYKGSLYAVLNRLDSPIKKALIKELSIEPRIEENVYFDNVDSFCFRKGVNSRFESSKILEKDKDFDSSTLEKIVISQIKLRNDYFLVGDSECITLFKYDLVSSEYIQKELMSLDVPLSSLISDLHDSFSFFCLTKEGLLSHYKIESNTLNCVLIENVERGVVDFCASFNYITFLTYYNTIHVVSRSDNKTQVLVRNCVEVTGAKIVKIFNDDEFLYIVYEKDEKAEEGKNDDDGQNSLVCCKYRIDNVLTEPEILLNVSHVWRTSNNGLICIQYTEKRNWIVECNKYNYPLGKKYQEIAFSKGAFCVWKDLNKKPEVLTLFGDTVPTSFYNGSCCFFFEPKYDTFVIKFNDDHSFYSKDEAGMISGKIDGKITDALSATVLGIDNIVFSTKNGIVLYFISKNERFANIWNTTKKINYGSYSINIDINNKPLTNLKPSPTYMNSFFGLHKSDLIFLSYDSQNMKIDERLLMSDVVDYSVSKTHLLVHFNDNSEIVYKNIKNNVTTNVFIYSLENVFDSEFKCDNFDYSYSIGEDFSNASYLIDDDFFYVFKHGNLYSTSVNSECSLYELDEKHKVLKPVSNYKNVLSLFDSFQVIIVMTNNRFVFKNKEYKYRSESDVNGKGQVSTLFAACQDEVMAWSTYVNSQVFSYDNPVIYKSPVSLKPIINCWYDGETAFLYKRGEMRYRLNDNYLEIKDHEMCRFLLPLAYDNLLSVSNDQFVVIHSGERIEKNVGYLASADYYRSDPSDLNSFFAYFQNQKKLFLIQYNKEFNSRHYCDNVVKFDVSTKYFVYIDTENKFHCMLRDAGIPRAIEDSNINEFMNSLFDEDFSDWIPFVDSDYIYMLNTKQKAIRKFIITKKPIELDSIENVVNVWSTNGIAIQTFEEEQYFTYTNHIKFRNINNQKIFACAMNDRTMCLWTKENKNRPIIKCDLFKVNLDEFYKYESINDRLEAKLNSYSEKLKKRVEQISKNVLKQRKNIDGEFDKVEEKFAKIKKMLQVKDKLSPRTLLQMSDQEFAELIRKDDFRTNYLVFGKTSSMFLLMLAKKIIDFILRNADENKRDLPFWIDTFYTVLLLIPIDKLTLQCAEKFLNGFREKIPDFVDWVESDVFDHDDDDDDDSRSIEIAKKKLNKKLQHIDSILASFLKL